MQYVFGISETGIWNKTDILSRNNSSTFFDDVFFVSFAYVTIGVVSFIPSLLFVIALFFGNLVRRLRNGFCFYTTESTKRSEISNITDRLCDEQDDEQITELGQSIESGNIPMRPRR
jgi:hypothetical protein